MNIPKWIRPRPNIALALEHSNWRTQYCTHGSNFAWSVAVTQCRPTRLWWTVNPGTSWPAGPESSMAVSVASMPLVARNPAL